MFNNKKGKLITIEGGDYVGKSTFIEQLKKDYPDFLYTREPGNLLDTNKASLCENTRKTILETDTLTIGNQAFLFAFNRKLHTEDIIEHINKGYTVICDRYVLSSFAYQGYAGDLGYFNVFSKNKKALMDLKANDIELNILVFKINKENYDKRKALRESVAELDAIEKKDKEFFENVNKFFNEDIYIDYLPTEAVNTNAYAIDANQSIEDVYAQGKSIIENIIK